MTDWNTLFSKDHMPDLAQVTAHIDNPLWASLCRDLEQTYAVQPRLEHSRCSGAPGWNVKYKKSGRSLCTLYPRAGYFTCLVAIGGEAATEAELMLARFTPEIQAMYRRVQPCNGMRWFMIDVKAEDTLRDVRTLIALRAEHKH